MVIGALFIAIAVMVGIGISIKKEADRIPESNVFLRLDFPGGITEYSSDDELVAELFGRKLSMPDLLDALEKAAADKRVTGIISKIDSVSLSYAQVQEIRKAIEKFKKSGKGLYAWSETFGEVGKGTKSYYLASVYDKIYLQHSGVLGFTGLAAESMFVRGLFDKLGVEVQGGHRKEYKTYWNMFVEKEMTKYHRESADRMVQSLFDQIVKDVGVDRKIEKDALLAIVDKAPLFSKEALDGGLIDGVKYRDEVYDSIDKKHGKSKFISISAYVNEMIRERVEKADAKNVALIYGGGGIKRGKSEYDPSGASSSIGSDTMSKAIRDAVEDKDVDAILIRIDSPGGSVIASEVVWREVIKAKEKGKPVVVSMSSLAASGGYYISMGADRIFAQPATLTGSIGVVVGKLYTLPFWEKIGIDFDSVQKGKNSMIFSSSKSLTEEQKAHMNRVLDTIYNDFVARAAEGRKMPFEKLEEVAKEGSGQVRMPWNEALWTKWAATGKLWPGSGRNST